MLILVGSNHRSAPIEVRERMSFPLERLPEALSRLAALEEIGEVLILSTCNRVEVVAWVAGDAAAGVEAVKRFLAEAHRLSLPEIDRYTYQLAGSDAARHLFAVACGLDSMILGEPQILGQVKQAYRAAVDQGTVGAMLDRLLQHCLQAAKRVRTETGIARHAVSVAFAAVELGRQIFGDLAGREALVLGAGKMGHLVARHLASHGVRSVSFASRTYTNAVLHAERVGGRAVPWEEGVARVGEVDVVVSCTGAAQHVLSKADVLRATRGRKRGPLLVIDIAVPRDVDPRVNEIDNVYLYDIDGLQNLVASNVEERRTAAEEAKRLVVREVQQFERWRMSQEITPVIVALREGLLALGQHELERYRGRLAGLDAKQVQAVEELTRAVIHKILHPPLRHLHGAVERGDVAECSALYRQIFALTEPPSKDTAETPGAANGSGPSHAIRGGRDAG
jgi:glutamyl-tRNA reductase